MPFSTSKHKPPFFWIKKKWLKNQARPSKLQVFKVNTARYSSSSSQSLSKRASTSTCHELPFSLSGSLASYHLNMRVSLLLSASMFLTEVHRSCSAPEGKGGGGGRGLFRGVVLHVEDLSVEDVLQTGSRRLWYWRCLYWGRSYCLRAWQIKRGFLGYVTIEMRRAYVSISITEPA